MEYYKRLQLYGGGGGAETGWSPVSMLSLTRHSPDNRAASQGSCKPS